MTEAVLLGIIQGLTEYIPVSSTAHLVIFSWYFGLKGMVNTLSFDVALHAGTLLAVILYFRKDWIDIFFRQRRLLYLIVVATIPAGAAGFFLNDLAESTFRNPVYIASALVVFSIVMFVSERFPKSRGFSSISATDAVMVGLAQVLALVPGVSRSGVTISAGLLRHLDRESAARFSFLLSTPIIGGAVLLHLLKIMEGGERIQWNILSAGIIASAVSGLIAIHFLMTFFRKHSLNTFVYYRLALGIIIVVSIWMKA